MASALTEISSRSPSTGEVLGTVMAATPAERAGDVRGVAEIQAFWAELPPSARARHLRRLSRAALDSGPELAELITREQGRPLTEAWTAEVVPAVRALGWLAARAARTLAGPRLSGGRRRPLPLRSGLTVEPRRVVVVELSATAPWRTAAERAGAALAAGAGVLLAPGPRCPLVGGHFAALAARAGLPDGLVRTVHGLAPGAEELRRAGADCVLGPAPLAARQADGPGSAMVVLADAELESALPAAVWAAFAYAGQGPYALRRLYVAGPAASAAVDECSRRASLLRLGDPLRWETEVGPLAGRQALAALQAELGLARCAGATVRCGGEAVAPAGLTGAWFAPAVVSGPVPERRAPGPVLAVETLAGDGDALAAVREAGPWTAVSLWTRDPARAMRMAPDLRASAVWVNAHDPTLDPAALALALDACVRRRPLGVGAGRDLRWHPYGPTTGRAARAGARLLYGPEGERLRTLVTERRALLGAARRAARRG